jgi:hypothetical protein
LATETTVSAVRNGSKVEGNSSAITARDGGDFKKASVMKNESASMEKMALPASEKSAMQTLTTASNRTGTGSTQLETESGLGLDQDKSGGKEPKMAGIGLKDIIAAASETRRNQPARAIASFEGKL